MCVSVLVSDICRWVLQQILSCEAREELVEKVHEYLRQIGEKVNTGQVPLAKFIITKVTKAIAVITDTVAVVTDSFTIGSSQ